jgi:hypothetical protein
MNLIEEVCSKFSAIKAWARLEDSEVHMHGGQVHKECHNSRIDRGRVAESQYADDLLIRTIYSGLGLHR